MAWELFLTGIPVAVLIAYMYFTHKDGTVRDAQTGQTYELQNTGRYEIIVAHERGGHSREEHIESTGTCLTCGASVGDAQHFCPNCGKHLK